MQRFVDRFLGLGYQDGSQAENVGDTIARPSSSLNDAEEKVVSSWEETREDVKRLMEAVQNGNVHGVLTAVQQGIDIDSAGWVTWPKVAIVNHFWISEKLKRTIYFLKGLTLTKNEKW